METNETKKIYKNKDYSLDGGKSITHARRKIFKPYLYMTKYKEIKTEKGESKIQLLLNSDDFRDIVRKYFKKHSLFLTKLEGTVSTLSSGNQESSKISVYRFYFYFYYTMHSLFRCISASSSTMDKKFRYNIFNVFKSIMNQFNLMDLNKKDYYGNNLDNKKYNALESAFSKTTQLIDFLRYKKDNGKTELYTAICKDKTKKLKTHKGFFSGFKNVILSITEAGNKIKQKSRVINKKNFDKLIDKNKKILIDTVTPETNYFLCELYDLRKHQLLFNYYLQELCVSYHAIYNNSDLVTIFDTLTKSNSKEIMGGSTPNNNNDVMEGGVRIFGSKRVTPETPGGIEEGHREPKDYINLNGKYGRKFLKTLKKYGKFKNYDFFVAYLKKKYGDDTNTAYNKELFYASEDNKYLFSNSYLKNYSTTHEINEIQSDIILKYLNDGINPLSNSKITEETLKKQFYYNNDSNAISDMMDGQDDNKDGVKSMRYSHIVRYSYIMDEYKNGMIYLNPLLQSKNTYDIEGYFKLNKKSAYYKLAYLISGIPINMDILITGIRHYKLKSYGIRNSFGIKHIEAIKPRINYLISHLNELKLSTSFFNYLSGEGVRKGLANFGRKIFTDFEHKKKKQMKGIARIKAQGQIFMSCVHNILKCSYINEKYLIQSVYPNIIFTDLNNNPFKNYESFLLVLLKSTFYKSYSKDEKVKNITFNDYLNNNEQILDFYDRINNINYKYVLYEYLLNSSYSIRVNNKDQDTDEEYFNNLNANSILSDIIKPLLSNPIFLAPKYAVINYLYKKSSKNNESYELFKHILEHITNFICLIETGAQDLKNNNTSFVKQQDAILSSLPLILENLLSMPTTSNVTATKKNIDLVSSLLYGNIRNPNIKLRVSNDKSISSIDIGLSTFENTVYTYIDDGNNKKIKENEGYNNLNTLLNRKNENLGLNLDGGDEFLSIISTEREYYELYNIVNAEVEIENKINGFADDTAKIEKFLSLSRTKLYHQMLIKRIYLLIKKIQNKNKFLRDNIGKNWLSYCDSPNDYDKYNKLYIYTLSKALLTLRLSKYIEDYKKIFPFLGNLIFKNTNLEQTEQAAQAAQAAQVGGVNNEVFNVYNLQYLNFNKLNSKLINENNTIQPFINNELLISLNNSLKNSFYLDSMNKSIVKIVNKYVNDDNSGLSIVYYNNNFDLLNKFVYNCNFEAAIVFFSKLISNIISYNQNLNKLALDDIERNDNVNFNEIAHKLMNYINKQYQSYNNSLYLVSKDQQYFNSLNIYELPMFILDNNVDRFLDSITKDDEQVNQLNEQLKFINIPIFGTNLKQYLLKYENKFTQVDKTNHYNSLLILIENYNTILTSIYNTIINRSDIVDRTGFNKISGISTSVNITLSNARIQNLNVSANTDVGLLQLCNSHLVILFEKIVNTLNYTLPIFNNNNDEIQIHDNFVNIHRPTLIGSLLDIIFNSLLGTQILIIISKSINALTYDKNIIISKYYNISSKLYNIIYGLIKYNLNNDNNNKIVTFKDLISTYYTHFIFYPNNIGYPIDNIFQQFLVSMNNINEYTSNNESADMTEQTIVNKLTESINSLDSDFGNVKNEDFGVELLIYFSVMKAFLNASYDIFSERLNNVVGGSYEDNNYIMSYGGAFGRGRGRGRGTGTGRGRGNGSSRGKGSDNGNKKSRDKDKKEYTKNINDNYYLGNKIQKIQYNMDDFDILKKLNGTELKEESTQLINEINSLKEIIKKDFNELSDDEKKKIYNIQTKVNNFNNKNNYFILKEKLGTDKKDLKEKYLNVDSDITEFKNINKNKKLFKLKKEDIVYENAVFRFAKHTVKAHNKLNNLEAHQDKMNCENSSNIINIINLLEIIYFYNSANNNIIKNKKISDEKFEDFKKFSKKLNNYIDLIKKYNYKDCEPNIKNLLNNINLSKINSKNLETNHNELKTKYNELIKNTGTPGTPGTGTPGTPPSGKGTPGTPPSGKGTPGTGTPGTPPSGKGTPGTGTPGTPGTGTPSPDPAKPPSGDVDAEKQKKIDDINKQIEEKQKLVHSKDSELATIKSEIETKTKELDDIYKKIESNKLSDEINKSSIKSTKEAYATINKYSLSKTNYEKSKLQNLYSNNDYQECIDLINFITLKLLKYNISFYNNFIFGLSKSLLYILINSTNFKKLKTNLENIKNFNIYNFNILLFKVTKEFSDDKDKECIKEMYKSLAYIYRSNKITSTHDDITTLKTDKNSIDSDIKTKNEEKINLESEIKTINDDIRKLNDELSKLISTESDADRLAREAEEEARKKAEEAKRKAAEEEAKRKAEIDKLAKEIKLKNKNLKDDLDTLEKTYKDYIKDKSNDTNKNLLLNLLNITDENKIEETYKNKVAEFKDEINFNEAELLLKEIEDLAIKLKNNYDNYYVKANNEINKLEKIDTANLDQNIKSKYTKMNSLYTEIEKLQKDFNDLMAECNKKYGEFTKFNKDIIDKYKKNINNEEEIKKIRENFNKKKEEYTEFFTTKLEELKKLKSDITNKFQELNNLNEDYSEKDTNLITTLSINISDITTNINTLKTELDAKDKVFRELHFNDTSKNNDNTKKISEIFSKNTINDINTDVNSNKITDKIIELTNTYAEYNKIIKNNDKNITEMKTLIINANDIINNLDGIRDIETYIKTIEFAKLTALSYGMLNPKYSSPINKDNKPQKVNQESENAKAIAESGLTKEQIEDVLNNLKETYAQIASNNTDFNTKLKESIDKLHKETKPTMDTLDLNPKTKQDDISKFFKNIVEFKESQLFSIIYDSKETKNRELYTDIKTTTELFKLLRELFKNLSKQPNSLTKTASTTVTTKSSTDSETATSSTDSKKVNSGSSFGNPSLKLKVNLE